MNDIIDVEFEEIEPEDDSIWTKHFYIGYKVDDGDWHILGRNGELALFSILCAVAIFVGIGIAAIF